MHSFAKSAVVVLVALAPTVHAQTAATSQPKKLYDDALVRERILRQELQHAGTQEAQSAVLLRVRALTGAYDDMSRLFATSGYADNALWQGAVLSADAFWEFGDAVDRATALRLFAALSSRFPSSDLTPKVASHTKRLQEAKPTASTPRRAEPFLGAEARSAKAAGSAPGASASAARPPVAQSPTTPPPTGLAALPSALTSITREVLPEVLRIVIQLGKEVPFYDERLGGPPRVFLDLQNTRAVATLTDAVIPFPDDVVKQVRVGRQPNQRTRVVLDLKSDAGRYSVYTLYDPYRIVVDFERKRAPAPISAAKIAPASEAGIAPPPVGSIAPPPDKIAPAPIAVIEARTTEPPLPIEAAETTPTAPLPPSANVNGGFSMSRQLGLGVARIVIDPGHGGHDPGAKARGIEEAELVLDVALRLEALLKDVGVEVVMTRRTDTFIALEERTAIANRVGADLFLSIHSNASASESARGVETYFLNFAANPEAEAVAARENAGGARTMRNLPDIVRAIALNNKIDESRDFASMVQSSLYTKLLKTNKSVRNLGVKQAPFMVLVGATMPSILAEISFITNKQEATLLKTDKYKQQIAEALLGGVLRYQQALKKVPAIAGR
jgi:N-acetylmuramoyl-L-alanine amidase